MIKCVGIARYLEKFRAAKDSMYSYSVSIEVNPPGETPVLTRDQLWRGLVKKADNASAFDPGIESWEVRERLDDGLIVECVAAGRMFREGVTFAPPVRVKYERVTGGDTGWTTNLISEGEKGMLLTFTFARSFLNVAAGSDEEKRRGDELKAECQQVIRETLKRIRQLVEIKEL